MSPFDDEALLLILLILLLADGICTGNSARLVHRDCPSGKRSDGLEIKYPFWDKSGATTRYCGYPDLGLFNDLTNIALSGTNYEVKQINYTEKTVDLLWIWEDSKCPWPEHSLDVPHYLTVPQDECKIVYFYRNCSFLPFPLTNLTCESDHKNNSLGTFIIDDFWASNQLLPRRCNAITILPVLKLVAGMLNSSRWKEALTDGFKLQWHPPDAACKYCEASGGLCKYDEQEIPSDFVCACPNGEDHPQACFSHKAGLTLQRGKALMGLLIILGAVIVSILVFVYRRELLSAYPRLLKTSKKAQEVEMFLEKYGSLAPRRYRYADIKKMTNSFKEKLGQGGYGSVFKGKLPNGSLVAVKVLTESKGKGDEFINEVATIGRTNHLNIVSLLGFCFETSRRALIYEYMPNGSLEKFIFADRSSLAHQLGWEMLHQIALGIARGLEYLHRGCSTRILHFDIKPHNILLDQDFCPKISDFGLAKLCPTRESAVSMVAARGTIGYTAPEMYCRNIGDVSYKSDVYSYGMMVLEMAGGRKNLDLRVENTSQLYFPHWIYSRLEQKTDMGLEIIEMGEEDVAKKLILVGLWCIQTDPAIRPTMSRVVEMLEGSVNAIQFPPKPFLDSLLRSQKFGASS